MDLIVHHGLDNRLMYVYDLYQDATPVLNRAVQRYGRVASSARVDAQIYDKWVGVPFFDRTDGYWVRTDKLAEAGIDVTGGALNTWQGVLDAAKAISRPDAELLRLGDDHQPLRATAST